MEVKQSDQTAGLICQFDRPVFKAVKINKIVDSGCCMIHHSIRYVDRAIGYQAHYRM